MVNHVDAERRAQRIAMIRNRLEVEFRGPAILVDVDPKRYGWDTMVRVPETPPFHFLRVTDELLIDENDPREEYLARAVALMKANPGAVVLLRDGIEPELDSSAGQPGGRR